MDAISKSTHNSDLPCLPTCGAQNKYPWHYLAAVSRQTFLRQLCDIHPASSPDHDQWWWPSLSRSPSEGAEEVRCGIYCTGHWCVVLVIWHAHPIWCGDLTWAVSCFGVVSLHIRVCCIGDAIYIGVLVWWFDICRFVTVVIWHVNVLFFFVMLYLMTPREQIDFHIISS